MKVALVIERLEPWRGGAETSTQQFVHHLLDAGVELEIVTRSSLPSAPRMQVHCLAPTATTRVGASASFAYQADRLLTSLPVDLVHAITPCLRADVYEPRGGTVVETMARNIAMRTSPSAQLLKRCLLRLNRRQQLMLRLERRLLARRPPPIVVALSDYVVRQLKTHYDYPDAYIRKVFNGADLEPLSNDQRQAHRREIRQLYGLADSDLVVLMVAHNFRLKGGPQWLEALAKAVSQADRPRPVRSLVVGRGSTRRWQRLAQRLGLADRVTFVGPTQRIAAFYAAADVLVHPTFYDPCSRVVLEGMAAGLPCITTRFDGASERIDDGVSGLVLDAPTDTDRLARCIVELADPRRRQAIGRQAAQAARQTGMAQHAAGVLAVYQELARQQGGP